MAVRQIYKDKAGKRLPSVTTIISRFKDSGGLLYWANSQGLDGKTLEEARIPAAEAGTLAHEMVEQALKGSEDPIADGLMAYAKGTPTDYMVDAATKAFGVYLKWRENTRLTFEYQEVSMISEQHRFGGRLDAIGRDTNGNLVLIDWKTSNSVYGDYLLQMAAYGIMWEESYPDHPITGGYHLCRFSKEEADFAHHYYDNLDKEKKVFIMLRDLYDRMKVIDKRAK